MMTTVAKFCAICIREPAPHREPLGRNDAMVNVCDRCATQPVVAVYHEHGYEPQGGHLHPEEVEAAMRRVMGDDVYEAQAGRAMREGLSPAPRMSQEDKDIRGLEASSRGARRADRRWARR